jgi:hypothetical protein
LEERDCQHTQILNIKSDSDYFGICKETIEKAEKNEEIVEKLKEQNQEFIMLNNLN